MLFEFNQRHIADTLVHRKDYLQGMLDTLEEVEEPTVDQLKWMVALHIEIGRITFMIRYPEQ
jgi:hypothetical protein